MEPGNGGGAFAAPTSADDFESTGKGREAGLGGALAAPASLIGRDGVGRSFATPAIGGFGAVPTGGLEGASLELSDSGTYGEPLSAPVSTPPPRFFNFGIPPAKSPPSCGASEVTELAPAPAPLSLLSLVAPGTDPPVDFNIPGTGGAPAAAAPPPPFDLSSKGPERSFVTAFLRPFPF